MYLFSHRKKMNFTTDLPKKHPFVTYIVASAVKCEKFFPNSKNEGPSFRMHAVILSKGEKQSKQSNGANSSGRTTKGKLMKENEEKLRENLPRLKEDSSVLISVPCAASIKSEESERNDLSLKDQLSVTSDRQMKEITPPAEKNYILCHIRKIDQNYKHSKFSCAKKESVCDLENEIEGSSKRKRKKSSRKGQVNALSKSAEDSHPTEESCAFDSFPRKFYASREESTPIRTNFPVFAPDTGSRISFESENSTSSTFPAMSGYVPGMMTTIPKLNFQSLRLTVGETQTPKQLSHSVGKNDAVKELKFDQGKPSPVAQPEKLSRIDNILANGVKRVANEGGCDYMQLFNLLTKFNGN